MLKKSIELLKNNPVLIFTYGTFSLIMFLLVLLRQPSDLIGLSNGHIERFDMRSYFITINLILLAAILIYGLSLLFISGYGNMMREAIINGKTTIKDFMPGIARYFGRVILMSLLLIAFSIGISLVLSIIMVPLIMLSLNNLYLVTLISTLVTTVSVICAIPFVLLWIPAIFLDNHGVVKGLVQGAKTGAKNYGKLLLLMVVMYIPSILNAIINFNTLVSGNLHNLGYLISTIVTMLLTVFYVPLIFIIYRDSNPPMNKPNIEPNLY